MRFYVRNMKIDNYPGLRLLLLTKITNSKTNVSFFIIFLYLVLLTGKFSSTYR